MRKGDTIRLVGLMNVMNKVVKEFGYARNTGIDTDVSYMSMGIISGLLVGMITLTAFNVPITLGAGIMVVLSFGVEVVYQKVTGRVIKPYFNK